MPTLNSRQPNSPRTSSGSQLLSSPARSVSAQVPASQLLPWPSLDLCTDRTPPTSHIPDSTLNTPPEPSWLCATLRKKPQILDRAPEEGSHAHHPSSPGPGPSLLTHSSMWVHFQALHRAKHLPTSTFKHCVPLHGTLFSSP